MISFETLISLIALVVAIASFLYTWHFNRYSITVDSRYKDAIEGQLYYSFVVNNTSGRSLTINNVELFNKDDHLIADNGFVFARDGDLERNPAFNSDPFTESFVLMPYSDIEFSYYLDERPSKIKVTTDHKIDKFHQFQTFNA